MIFVVCSTGEKELAWRLSEVDAFATSSVAELFIWFDDSIECSMFLILAHFKLYNFLR